MRSVPPLVEYKKRLRGVSWDVHDSPKFAKRFSARFIHAYEWR